MFERFLDDVVDEHSVRRRRAGDEFIAMDTLDLLLDLDDPNLEVPIERDGVKAFTQAAAADEGVEGVGC